MKKYTRLNQIIFAVTEKGKKPMTDNEVIKALEGMIQFADTVDRSVLDMVDVQTLKNTLDLINRQKAEIEELKTQFRYLDVECERLERIEEAYENLKKEKEQLEKDKENLAYSFANVVGQKNDCKSRSHQRVCREVKKRTYNRGGSNENFCIKHYRLPCKRNGR